MKYQIIPKRETDVFTIKELLNRKDVKYFCAVKGASKALLVKVINHGVMYSWLYLGDHGTLHITTDKFTCIPDALRNILSREYDVYTFSTRKGALERGSL